MTPSGLVLAPCAHASSETGSGTKCKACLGSGWVPVVPGPDGKPVACEHAWVIGEGTGGDRCNACLGSGWAGLVVLT